MKLQDTLFTAVVGAFAALTITFTATAAPQDVVKLERVVVTGKAVRADAQVVAQLPRVVVTGYSESTLLRNTTLAAAKSNAKRG